MIKGLYALPPDVGAYLARIGLAPEDFRRAMHPELPPSPTDYSIPHTKESLDLLVHAHLFHVPFENIDGYDLHREVSLEIPDIFDKIVTRRRGGYCFELNALFSALLEALGFSCYAVGQRVLREGSFPPVSHRVTVVTLPQSGERVLCDIAFGGPSPVMALYPGTGRRCRRRAPCVFASTRSRCAACGGRCWWKRAAKRHWWYFRMRRWIPWILCRSVPI